MRNLVKTCGYMQKDGTRCSRPADKDFGGKCSRNHLESSQNLPAFTGRKLPEKYQKKYDQFIENKDYLSQKNNLALLNSRIEVIAEDTYEGGLRDLFLQMQKIVKKLGHFEDELSDPDSDYTEDESTSKGQGGIEELRELIEIGVNDYKAWEEIEKVADLHSKISKTEMDRLEKLHMMLPIDQVRQWQVGFMDVVKRNIQEWDCKTFNADAFGRILSKELAKFEQNSGQVTCDPNTHVLEDNGVIDGSFD